MRAAFEILAPVSERIWDLKYRLKAADGSPIDRVIDYFLGTRPGDAPRPEMKWKGKSLDSAD